MITTFAFVIFAVGVHGRRLAPDAECPRQPRLGQDDHKGHRRQVAKNDTHKTDTPSQTKATEQPKATQSAPPPQTKAETRPPETKAEMVKNTPPETKPAPKPPDPPPVKKPDPPPPAPDPTVPVVFFDKDIVPVFQVKCNRCHGEGKIKGKLDLRSMAAIMKGGENGPALVPNTYEKGTIYVEVFKEKSMPPKGEPALTEDQKKLIENWIKGGGKASAVAGGPAPAPPPGRGGAVLAYEKNVLPILTAKCGKCHDSTSLKSELDVTSLAVLKKGGKSGRPAVTAGDLKKSDLWEQIESGNMPQGDNPKLTPAEMETIKNWITMGAKDNKAAMLAAAKYALSQSEKTMRGRIIPAPHFFSLKLRLGVQSSEEQVRFQSARVRHDSDHFGRKFGEQTA